MAKDNAKPGDTVELADKTIGFTDPDTGFDISRDQKVELTDPIGRRTHEALVSGGLLIVSGKSSKRNLGAGDEGDDGSDLPKDLPGRDAFVAAGMNFEQVKALKTEEDLLSVNGIGKKTVADLKTWAKKNRVE